LFIHARHASIWLVIMSAGFAITGCLPALAQTSPEASALSVASIRSALAQEHALIAAHPHDARNYINLAYTLTDAGAGEQAYAAAAEATRVDPQNAFAFSAQGWVLHHNSIGVDYGNGFDYDGSSRAFQRAIELDPQDLNTRQSSANLLEFNRAGIRYAPDAQLSLAIDAYRYVKQHQPVPQAEVLDNLAFDLFYAGRYDEALAELTGIPTTPQRLGIFLASVAAAKGSAAAITLSNQIPGDEQNRKNALTLAAEGLWNKRLYAQAADLLTASLPDPVDGASIASKIQIFRDLKPFIATSLPASDPRLPVQRLLEKAFTSTLDDASMQGLMSRHSYATDAAWSGALQQSDTVASILLASMKQTGLPRAVVADIVLGTMSVTASSGSRLGTPVRVQLLGLSPLQFFVICEQGTWKLAATGQGSSAVGTQALYLLQSNNADTAQSLLNWYDSLLGSSEQAGDPLSVDLFSRLWAPSARAGAEAPLLAATALTGEANLLQPLVPAILSARDKASTSSRRTDLNQLLATVYLRLHDAPNSLRVASQLLAHYPESITALRLVGQSYERAHNWPAWKALLAERLKSDQDNRQLLLESATEAVAEGDYTRARQAYRHILDGTHGTSEDDTMYAWAQPVRGQA
jgi:cytochrome c-type biogenesis protein CcmH/NrfG